DSLAEWMKHQLASVGRRRELMSEAELETQSREFLEAFASALQAGAQRDLQSPAWSPIRELLTRVSQTRAVQGFSPSETAGFVFSLKQPLFTQLREAVKDPSEYPDEMWHASTILDDLGLLTTEAHQKTREEVIMRQQQEVLELSTPVVTLWDGVLALPLIGTLDSARTQVVMESLLQRIVETGSLIAI